MSHCDYCFGKKRSGEDCPGCGHEEELKLLRHQSYPDAQKQVGISPRRGRTSTR